MKRNLLRILPLILFGGVLGLAAAPVAFEATVAKAEDGITFTKSDFSGGKSGGGAPIEASKNGITITGSSGYLPSANEFRIYDGAKLTIESTNYNISQVDFTFNSKRGGLDDSYTDIDKKIWFEHASGQAAITSIKVTLSKDDVLISSLSIDTSNAKTSFVKGQTLDLTGLKVDGNKVGGGSVDVTSQCSFSPAAGTELSNVGSTTVNVTYTGTNTPATETGEDLTASYNVTVTEGEKENVFTKVDSIADGDKIIIVNSGESRAATVISDSCLDTNEITVADDTAKFKDSDGITVFTVVENDDDTYSFKNSADKYLGVTGTKDDPKVVTFGSDISSKTSWTMVGTSLMNCCSDSSSHTKKYLQYNASTNDFRMYGKNMADVEFFKYTSGAEKILVQSTASVLEEASVTISSTAQGFTPSSYLWTVGDAETLQIVGDNNKESVTVKGLKPGSANLTITANGDDELSATCVVTVIAKKDAVIENGEYFIADYSGSHVLNVNLEDIVGPDYADSSVMWNIQNNGVDGDTYTISNGSNYLIHNPNIKNSSLYLTTDSSTYWVAEKVEDGVYNLAYSETGNLLSCNPGANTGTWFAYDNPTGDQAKIKLLKLGNLIDFSVTGPTKKTYYVGEELSTTNLKVIANFDNGAHPDVTSKVVWDELVAGTQATGTFECGGDAYEVVVDGLSILGPVAGSMQVTGLRDTYLIGEMPKETIEEVKVTYSDGVVEEVKTLKDSEFDVSPAKINSSTTKIVVSMVDDPEVKFEKEITPEHAKYFATNMIEIGDKVTLGTTVGAKDGNITGGQEIAIVDGSLKCQSFGYLPAPAMEFTVKQGVSSGTYAFEYNGMYLTSNGGSLDFGHVTKITASCFDNIYSFDFPYYHPVTGQYVSLKFTETDVGSEAFNAYYAFDNIGGERVWAESVIVDDQMMFTFEYYTSYAAEKQETYVNYPCEFNGTWVISIPAEQTINEKNSFICNYVESQNDLIDDYWEICPVNESSKHVYFNKDSNSLKVDEKGDYNTMLYRDMTKDFSHEIKSLSVSIPEDMPTTVELGEPYNWVGITVKAKYDNTTKKLPLGAYEVDVPSTDTYGEKTCTVTYGTSGNKVTAIFKFTVVGGYQPFIKQNTSEVWVDDTNTFTTTHEPPEGEPVTWSSSNPTIANFEDPSVGDLTSYKSGEVTIKVTSYDGYYSDTLDLVVLQRPTGLTLSETEKTIKQGEKFTLVGTVLPSDASNKTVLWSTSDPTIATVNSKGEVTGLGIGDVIITGQTQGKGTGEEEGYKATCTVHVEKGEVVKVTGVSLIETKEIEIGASATLTPIIEPSNATEQSVTWESKYPEIVTVDKNGKITGKKKGTSDVTVTTLDGGFTATCRVTVKENVEPIPVSSISLNATSKKIDVDETFEIVATINPVNADDKHINWSSSDEDVVEIISVGPSGVTVKGMSDGTANITASCGGKTATCTVTVVDPSVVINVESVSLNKSSCTLEINEQVSLIPTINPIDATDKSVTWSSSNENVATVDANGKVTAIAEGTATITVTTEDGNKTASCNVKVIENPTPIIDVEFVSILINGKEATEAKININETIELSAFVGPEDAGNKDVIWSTSNANIATVDENGKVTGIAAGTAAIVVTTVDGGKMSTLTIKVVDKTAQTKNIVILSSVAGGAVVVGAGCGIGIPLGIKAKKRKLLKK